jgi:PAS domain S-box-containing protein
MPKTKPHSKRTDELRKKAEARIARQLDRIESASAEDIPRLIHELRIHQVELEVQNEELRMAHADLEVSRSKYAHLYDFAPVAYLTMSKDGVIEEANLTAVSLLGSDRKALVGNRVSCFVAPEDSAVFHQHMIRTLETGVKQTCQLKLAERAGEKRHVQVESLLLDGGNKGQEKISAALIDISSQKSLEQRLLETEKSYRTLAENSPDVIARFDRNLRYIYVNPAIELHTGIPHERFFDKTNEEVGMPPQLTALWEAAIRKVFEAGVRERIEFDYAAPGGSTSFHAWAVPELNEKGKVESVLTIVRDVSDLKREQARLRTILENVPVAIIVADEMCRLTMANQLAKEIYGRPIPLGQPVETHVQFDLYRPDGTPYDPLDLPLSRSVFQGEIHKDVEMRIMWPDGRKHALLVNTAPIRDPNGKVLGAMGAFKDVTDIVEKSEALLQSRDALEARVQNRTTELLQAKSTLEAEVSERRRAEAVLKAHEEELEKLNVQLKLEIEKRKKFEKVLKSSTEKIIQEHNHRKALSRQLVELLEKDRREVAMALHDHAGQILTTLKMDLEATENKVSQRPALLKLKAAKRKTLDLLAFMRDTSAHLRPTTLDTLGLAASVRHLIEQLQPTTEAKIALHASGLPKSLGHDIEIALYRIIQESLTNALKYAHAKNIFVNMIRKGKRDTVLLGIEDDGQGFDHSGGTSFAPPSGHFGITIMRERAVLLGGDFRIESQPGKGTVVMVEIPFGEIRNPNISGAILRKG